jgi:hypothetical protein
VSTYWPACEESFTMLRGCRGGIMVAIFASLGRSRPSSIGAATALYEGDRRDVWDYH